MRSSSFKPKISAVKFVLANCPRININEYYAVHPENITGEIKFASEMSSGGLYSRADASL